MNVITLKVVIFFARNRTIFSLIKRKSLFHAIQIRRFPVERRDGISGLAPPKSFQAKEFGGHANHEGKHMNSAQTG
jgi:hypothetical protein